MGDVINFRAARKDLARKTKEEAAGRNRAAFGRTKVQKQLEAKVTELADRRLESHRRDAAHGDDGLPDDDGKTPA